MIDRHAVRHPGVGLLATVTLTLFTLATSFGQSIARADGEVTEVLRNKTYPSDWTRNGRAPLVGGLYEEQAAPGSASKIVVRLTDSVVVSTIDGQTVAALVIVTDPGGSGIFFDLFLAQQRENRWRVVDRAYLGDRIRVHALEVAEGLISLDLTVHGPRDGACCPTGRSRVYFALQDGRLVTVDTSIHAAASSIEGQVWTWQHTVRLDGTRTTPAEPGHYTFRLGPDRQLAVRADCNRAGGAFRLEAAHLTLSVTHSTMAACPPESLDRQFLADVAAISTWRLEGSSLHVDLTGGGTMVFTATGR